MMVLTCKSNYDANTWRWWCSPALRRMRWRWWWLRKLGKPGRKTFPPNSNKIFFWLESDGTGIIRCHIMFLSCLAKSFQADVEDNGAGWIQSSGMISTEKYIFQLHTNSWNTWFLLLLLLLILLLWKVCSAFAAWTVAAPNGGNLACTIRLISCKNMFQKSDL